jgi:carbon monoxide dehydrogenase subunit G
LKIGGSYELPLPPARAYAVLQDPVILARCMPGCDHLSRIGATAEGHVAYEMKMKMVISSIQGLFAGTVTVADPKEPSSFRLIVEGKGKAGFMKGEGLLTFIESGAGAEVRYEGDVKVGGVIAGVGQRLLDVTAKHVIKKFFGKVVAAIEEMG